MSHNVYTMYSTDDLAMAQREEAGFTGGNFSKDGMHVLGDLGQDHGCENCDHDLEVPVYLPSHYDVITYKGKDTGKTEIIDGNEFPIYKKVEVITSKPLTNNHPHYNHEQAKFIVSSVEWETRMLGVS